MSLYVFRLNLDMKHPDAMNLHPDISLLQKWLISDDEFSDTDCLSSDLIHNNIKHEYCNEMSSKSVVVNTFITTTLAINMLIKIA